MTYIVILKIKHRNVSAAAGCSLLIRLVQYMQAYNHVHKF